MGRSERVPAAGDGCDMARRWILDPTLARMLVQLDAAVGRQISAGGFRWAGLYVISGYRSASLQARINPAVPKSLHSQCPSLAVDLRVANLPASTTPYEMWSLVGYEWKKLGGSWGGDFATPDLNHFVLPTGQPAVGGRVARKRTAVPAADNGEALA